MPPKRTHPVATEPAVAPEQVVAFQGHPGTRMRAADYVFETLARAILSGELAPDTDLATQRELSTQFAVSPLVIRQATHRLEEIGLVRVRQGSTTTVLDPNQATDVRLIQLQLELARTGDQRLALAARENQALSTLPMLTLAERRIQEPELVELERLIDGLPESASLAQTLAFRVAFWGLIARSTRNPIVEQQVRWWAGVMRKLEKRGVAGWPARTAGASPEAYRGLIRALRRRRGAVAHWQKTLEPLFDWTESQPDHALQQRPAQRHDAGKPTRAAR